MTSAPRGRHPARLVCCGLATLDVVQVVDAIPAPDRKVVARALDVTFGGPAANAAATAVALGVPTRLVTALGGSPLASLVRAALVAAGVEVVDLLDGDPAASPAVSSVLVTAATGERAVVSVNATATGDLAHVAAARAASALAGATALLVDGHHLGAGIALARHARADGVPVALDGGSWKPGLDELLAHVDAAVLSADFVLPGAPPAAVPGALPAAVPGALPGALPVGAPGPADDDALDALLDEVAGLGPRDVARSAGAGPVRVRGTSEAIGRLPEGVDRYSIVPHAVDPAEVVDTLGAGDVLHGALAAGLAQGEPFGAALASAVTWATESVRHRGALGWAAQPR